MKNRELWLDYLRSFACILVTLGHLFMSFQESAIRDTVLISYVIEIIYHFHVYIFFFCSGYLLQKSYQQCDNRKIFVKYTLTRCIDFLIVYVLFSGVTFVIKLLLAGDVNTPIEHTFIQTLLQYPVNQMWYLYAIAIITLCTPMVKKETANIVLTIAIILKVIMCIPACSKLIPVPLNYLGNNQIWYVIGSLWAFHKVVLKKNVVITLVGIFILTNTLAIFAEVDNAWCNTLLTFVGITASAGVCNMVAHQKDTMHYVWKLLTKHMLPIYLMHTICAAGIRIVLLKLDITNYGVHLIMGLLFSFVVPIVCGEIADKSKILNICFYPIKTIQKMRK